MFLADLGNRFYLAWIEDNRYISYFKGLGVTLQISFFAILIGVLIGVFVAVIRVNAKTMPWLRPIEKIASLYVTVIRGTPVILQLFIIYNLIFVSPDVNEIMVGAICFGFNSGAYVSEIIRSGINSVDKGQMEAGRSLGFTQMETMNLIILPQALRNILPALGNEFIVLIKETSIASVIAITDLTKVGSLVASRTFDVLPPYFIVAGFYLVIVLILQKLLDIFERRLEKSDRY